MNSNQRPVNGQSKINVNPRPRGSRTSASYWKDRVYQAKAKGGKLSSDYSARIEYLGRRVRFALSLANREDAASKAAEIFRHLSHNGWEATLGKYKGEKKMPRAASVGAMIEQFSSLSDVSPRTTEDYAKSLRKIAGEISGLSTKEDGWRDAVDRVPLSRLNSESVQRWKLDFVGSAGDQPDSVRKKKTTANTLLRNARSLFTKKVIKHLPSDFEMPNPPPFAQVEFYPRQSMRYVSRIDVKQLIADAKKDLGGNPEKQEEWKIFVLGILGGMRRKEIDSLLWEQVDFVNEVIEIRATRFFTPKAESSAGEIDLEPGMVKLLRSFHASSSSEFVVSGLAPRPEGAWARYRCNSHHKALITWLRSWKTPEGATPLAGEQKPIHALRKECGSLVCEEMGLFAASRFLRHANTVVTSEYYVAKKGRITTGLGDLVGT